MAMAGGLFGVDMPRPRGSLGDNLLGIDGSGDIGMTDSSFQGMGRAPVDELFAGRNSAVINDAGWDLREKRGRAALKAARAAQAGDEGKKPWEKNWAGTWRESAQPVLDPTEGGADDRRIRNAVTEATGLMMYPGDAIKSDVDNAVFMQEFDDTGATLVDGWRDGQIPSTLGGLLNHDELYKHYPELQDLPLSVEALGERLMGSYGGIDQDHGLGRMKLNSSMSDKDIMDTVLHEAQHYIQRLENWPGGGGHNEHSRRNFTEWHPERVDGWREVAKNNPDHVEEVVDHATQEAYENISGEILARDVEQRFNTRNSLNNVIDQLDDPNSEINNLPQDQWDEVVGRAKYTANALDYYPAHPRDTGNSYPHNMPESNPMTNPYVMMNAMGARIDSHGIKDDDTLNAYANADSLFEEAYRAMQNRK